MNVRIEKPIKKGEQRHGVLTREMNGTVCFDETDQKWLNNPTRKSLRLKKFEPYGTRVTRKAGVLVIKQEVPVTGDCDFQEMLHRSLELSDAMMYIGRYMERRRGHE